MRYPIVAWESGNSFVVSKRATPSSTALTIDYAGSSDEIDLYIEVEHQVNALINEALGRWQKNPKLDKDQIEGELAIAVFPFLDKLPTKVLTDLNFWRFLSCVPFYEFINWRDGDDCKLQSFGVSSPGISADCVPYRMYLRVNVTIGDLENFDFQDKNSTLYKEISKGRRTDVWRSHILRVKTAYAPVLVRELLSQHSAGRIPTSVVRETAKVIRRKRSNIIFEMLAADETIPVVYSSILKGEELVAKRPTKL